MLAEAEAAQLAAEGENASEFQRFEAESNRKRDEERIALAAKEAAAVAEQGAIAARDARLAAVKDMEAK